MGAAKRSRSTTTPRSGSRKTGRKTTRAGARKASGTSSAETRASKTAGKTTKKAAAPAARRSKASPAKAKAATKKTTKKTGKSAAKAARKPAQKAAAAKKSASRTVRGKAGKAAAPKKQPAKKPVRKPAKKPAGSTRAASRGKTTLTAARSTKKSKTTPEKSTRKPASRKPPKATRPKAKPSSAKPAPARKAGTVKHPAKKASREATTPAKRSRTKPAAAETTAARPKKARRTEESTAASAARTKTRSEKLPETQSESRVKSARRSKATASRADRKARKSGETRSRSASKRPAEQPAKKRREKRPKPPAKTMNAPEPVREVLVFADLPDVRRALTAKHRRDKSRGHLQPHLEDEQELSPEDRQPLDATLIMNTLAVDVQPKIEDNYDYTVLDEFRESGFCPRPTRMVNTGCGGGEASVYFAKLGFNCVGIDPDRADVGLARERAWLAGVDIDFMVGDLFETPNLLPAESFGLAVDRGAFFHIHDERDRQRYLGNIKRLLFRGGVLMLSAGYFPMEEDSPRKGRSRKGGQILLASEGGVVVQEMRAAGFQLMKRVLRQTADSGELGELILYLKK